MHIFKTGGIEDGGFIPRNKVISYPHVKEYDDPYESEVETYRSFNISFLEQLELKVRVLGGLREVMIEQLSNETELKLERKLRNEEPGIRGLAIEALARKNTPKAIELIISSLGDEDYSVRLTSIFEVVKLKIKEAIPSLIEIINNDENNEVVAVATDVLGDLGAEEAIPSLIEKLTDDNETVREAAADSLGKLGAKEAVEPLRMLLNDDEEFVRETAKRAIEKIERKKET